MGKIAFMFSGQGAQHPGMGKDFYDSSKTVKQLFDQAELIRNGTLKQCFEGSEEELKQTENTQPCLYLADIAAAIVLKEKGIEPDAVAGFSLGEIPSLAFAGAFSPIEGFKIACKRGEVMGEVSKNISASMAAVLKLDDSKVEELCEKYDNLFPVNYNSPGQVVVSGLMEELEVFKDDVRTAGGRLLPLAVGGAFHSPFMNPAAEAFGNYLKNIQVQKPEMIAYSNYTAQPYDESVKELMEKQINHPVKWASIIQKMADTGFDTFIEVGVGTVLQKLVSRILPSAKCYAVESNEGVSKVLEEVTANK